MPLTSILPAIPRSYFGSTTAVGWRSSRLIIQRRDRLGVRRHKTLPPYLTRAASHILELKTKRARIRRLEPQVCRIKLQPVVALEPAVFDAHRCPERGHHVAQIRDAGGYDGKAAGLRQETAVRAADVTAGGQVQRLAAGIADEVGALAAATLHAHGIVGERAGIDVAIGRRLETDAVDGRNRARASEDRAIAALKVAADDRLLQGVCIRRQQACGRACEPKAVEEQVLATHEAGMPDLDPCCASIEKYVGKTCSTAVPDLRPTHPNRDQTICRQRRQSAVCPRSANSRIHS